MLRRYIRPWPWLYFRRYKSSLSDTFRLALHAVTDGQLVEPNSEPVLPARVKKLLRSDNIKDQFSEIVEKRLLSTNEVAKIYFNVQGELDSKNILSFCHNLYDESQYGFLCKILIENIFIGESLYQMFECLFKDLCKKDHPEFVVGNLISGLVSIGQIQMSHHLFQELGFGYQEIDRLCQQAQLVNDIAEVASNIDDRMAYLMIRNSIDRHFPQLMSHHDLSLWTRLHLWMLMVKINPRYFDLIFNKFHENFIGKKYVLANFIKSQVTAVNTTNSQSRDQLVASLTQNLRQNKNFFDQQDLLYLPLLAYDGKSLNQLWKSFKIYKKTEDEWKDKLELKSLVTWSSSKNTDPSFIQNFQRLKKHHPITSTSCESCNNSRLNHQDGSVVEIDTLLKSSDKFQDIKRSSLNILASAAKPFPQYNNDDYRERRLQVYTGFLRKAIELEQSITISDIIKTAKGQFEPDLLSEAFSILFWGRKNIVLKSTEELFTVPHVIDISLLVRTINAISLDRVARPLYLCFRRLNAMYPLCKGLTVDEKILWNALLAIEESNLKSIPSIVEREIAHIVAYRPHVEQLRYMSLSKVSSQGIFSVLLQYLRYLHASNQKNDLRKQDEADVRLILAGLILIKEKQSLPSKSIAGAYPTVMTTVPSTDRYFAKIITNLFENWERERAFEVMDLLQSQKIQPPENILIGLIAKLSKTDRSTVALELLRRIPEPTKKSYLIFLTTTSKSEPKLCYSVIKWLEREKKIFIPAPVYRSVAAAFACSLKLTDAQSKRYTMAMIKRVRQQKAPIGPKLAQIVVTSLLNRAKRSQWGSRKRLQWALEMARVESVPNDVVDEWMSQLGSMRAKRIGYWAPGRYSYGYQR